MDLAHACHCPSCGAPPEHLCNRSNGQPTTRPHAARANLGDQLGLVADGVHARVLANEQARANMLRANGLRANGPSPRVTANLARANVLRANGGGRYICPSCNGSGDRCNTCNSQGVIGDKQLEAYTLSRM